MMNSDLQDASKRILILGCGWVGEEFAIEMKKEGYEVWLTTTTEEKWLRLSGQGFETVLLDFDTDEILWGEDLPTTFDFVLNSIPASSRNSGEVLLKRFRRLKTVLEQLTFRKHIYLSSIGIYPDVDGFFEENWLGDLDERLLLAEESMQHVRNTLIYRLGGLFGKERVFVKYFAGKICHTGDQPANFIHIADVVSLLRIGFFKLDTKEVFNKEVFNIVAPEHPTKKDVIIASAGKYGFELPLAFEPIQSFQKIVSGQKITNLLAYSFRYPSPLYF